MKIKSERLTVFSPEGSYFLFCADGYERIRREFISCVIKIFIFSYVNAKEICSYLKRLV